MKKNVTLIIRSRFSVGGLVIAIAAIAFTSHAQNTWTQQADFPASERSGAVGFSIGTKGYIGTGDFPYKKDFWQYDPVTDSWNQKADFGGDARGGASGFSIGNKGYIGTGHQNYDEATAYYKDFWEYDPDNNSWTQKADFGGNRRSLAVGFSIGNKGYIGTGFDIAYPYLNNDFWEYDPVNDTWTKKADFGGTARGSAVGFSIDDKGYIGMGQDNLSEKKDFWEYDPGMDTWTRKADFGDSASYGGVGFSIGDKGYVGTGYSEAAGFTSFSYFWQYDPAADIWTQKADFGGTPRFAAVGFSIGSKGYIGTGLAQDGYKKDFWEYTPDISCEIPANPFATDITSTTANLKWDAAAGAEKYKLRYKVYATNDWITLYPVAHHKVIAGLLPSTQYTWQVKTICQADSPSVVSAWSAKQHFTTASTRLVANAQSQPLIQIYRNPAQDYTTIQFTLPQTSKVSVIVCDLSGREIEVIMNNQLSAGEHSFQLNTSKFSKGIYVVKMMTDFGIENKKLIVQ